MDLTDGLTCMTAPEAPPPPPHPGGTGGPCTHRRVGESPRLNLRCPVAELYPAGPSPCRSGLNRHTTGGPTRCLLLFLVPGSGGYVRLTIAVSSVGGGVEVDLSGFHGGEQRKQDGGRGLAERREGDEHHETLPTSGLLCF